MDQNKQIYCFKVLLVAGIAFGSRSLELSNKNVWMYSIARYVLYILTVRAMHGACAVVYDLVHHKRPLDAQLLSKVNVNHAGMFAAVAGFLLFNEQTFIDKSFFFILIATVVTKFPEIEKKKKDSLNYAVWMACSYFEGYLVHILPSDGAKFFGFLENMRVYEDRQGVVFPVRKLFIVATKSLYSPPQLEDLNPPDRIDVAKVEACSPLTEIEKNVAGVRNRIYKNFAYKIYRPGRLPVYLSAIGGTPMYTLYKVLRNRDLSQEIAGINREETVSDFFKALRSIIAKSPECRDKCELIYFDDTDRDQNLADVLLNRIRELEPNFEEIIAQRSPRRARVPRAPAAHARV
ncbi:hypothetical protein PYW07_004877 [Mythimna separata]|uniref:STING ligand-binding domain-containing protein n=1 Tax=Mythimna separata TaxID=271217 RepID=A0AAD7YDF4_MYTSE|nr:hypothetical protein PYW07_004877 [Mythimna separata]